MVSKEEWKEKFGAGYKEIAEYINAYNKKVRLAYEFKAVLDEELGLSPEVTDEVWYEILLRMMAEKHFEVDKRFCGISTVFMKDKGGAVKSGNIDHQLSLLFKQTLTLQNMSRAISGPAARASNEDEQLAQLQQGFDQILMGVKMGAVTMDEAEQSLIDMAGSMSMPDGEKMNLEGKVEFIKMFKEYAAQCGFEPSDTIPASLLKDLRSGDRSDFAPELNAWIDESGILGDSPGDDTDVEVCVEGQDEESG